jgi:hypothetical protein
MSRFKSGRRIEAALEHRDKKELNWAESYCQGRLRIASRKDHIKHWQQVLDKVRSVLEEI